MKAVIAFLKQKILIQIAGISALCVLIWFLGPKLALAGKTPLEPAFNRLLAILIVVIVWALFNLIKQSLAGKKEQALMAELAAPQVDPAQAAIEAAQTEESDALRRKFEQALQLLKDNRSRSRRDKQFIYELPWYVIIGAPGCGKTTLLENSGLNFPLSGQLDRSDITGVGGTRNCDWLFADDAIFLDTAGRYTTQDSHQPVDASAWHEFLDLIKKYRPRRPINGVLVATSISDLLSFTEDEIRQHAEAIRSRISELFTVLGNRFPVYMIFTKCDMVAGFSDYFARLTPQDRAQVWGETFAENDSLQPRDFVDQFLKNFDPLMNRLQPLMLSRIQEEKDVLRRSLILNFPNQMTLLKPRLKVFLHHTFNTSRYDKHVPMLRGAYLTSGTQEGTPIDRVMGHLAAAFGLDRQQAPVYSGKGKSYFITRLLKEVIFPEAQLAGSNAKVERRLLRFQLAAYAAVLVIAGMAVALWSFSYVRNGQAIEQVAGRIDQYHHIANDHVSWQRAVGSILARLNTIKAADAVYEDHTFWMGFGLFQGDKLQAGMAQVYERLLENQFLPMVIAQLEQRILAHLNSGSQEDVTALYELLKVYLMFENPKQRMNRDLAARRINADWRQRFLREPELQAQLQGYTNDLLAGPLEPIALNPTVIGQARRVLNTQPLYAQIYAHIRAEGMADHTHDFQMHKALPPQSDLVFTCADGQDLGALMVPGFFTYDGYHDFFSKKGLDYVKKAVEENWVLDNYAAAGESNLPRLYDDMQKIYFDQYEKQWRGLVDNLEIKKARGISQEIQILDILSGPETPLRPLLAAVEKNTTLSFVPGAKEGEQGADATVNRLMTAGLPEPAVQMEKHFKDIHHLVRSKEGMPSPLDHLIGSLNDVRDFMMQIGSAADSDDKALKKALERIQGGGASERIKTAQMTFDRQPEPFKSWFSALTSSSTAFTLAGAKSEINAIWKSEVVAFYKAALQGRYPVFKQSAYDITFDDFCRFFGPDGTIDRFFQTHLKPFVDTSRSQWLPKTIDNHRMHLSADTLKQLQYAAKVRDTFFVSGGAEPSVRFELKPMDMDNDLAFFRIDLEGQVTEYRHDPPRSMPFAWPGPQSNAGVRLTARTIDGREINREEEGPWAWMKILDRSIVGQLSQSDRFKVDLRIGRYSARYELRAGTVRHPFQLKALQQFRCPESL